MDLVALEDEEGQMMINSPDFDLWNGLDIVISPALILGYKRKKRHKKKRVDKKWLKRYGFAPIYDMEHVYIMGNTIIMSKGLYEYMQRRHKDEQ